MVQFGKRLKALMRAGWENKYVDYEGLKEIVSKLQDANTEEGKETLSKLFSKLLSRDISQINQFYLEKLEVARDQVEKLRLQDNINIEKQLETTAHSNSTTSISLEKLFQNKDNGLDESTRTAIQSMYDLLDELKGLRKFVATNVIAVTKIVKKHDKNVPENLAKRREAANFVVQQSFYKDVDLPQLFSVAKELINSKTGGKLDTVFHEEKDGDESDSTEAKNQHIADWLLASARLEEAVTVQSIHIDNVKIVEENREEEKQEGNDNFSNFVKNRFFHIFFGKKFSGSFSDDEQYFTSSYERDEKWTEIVVEPGKQSKDTQRAMETVLENYWRVNFKDDSEKPWKELTGKEKVQSVLSKSTRLLLVLGFLYLFICCLSFLADGFRLVAGKRAGEIFGDSEILGNPVSGLMVGVLATVLVQSSSTSTSITIAMVAAELLTTTQAIYIIMGANIGTSVTSTIVALGQANDRSEFRRAFAAATIHDCFNFLTVLILLPLEASFHYLKFFSSAIIAGYTDLKSAEKCDDCFTLKTMTKPFTKSIVSIDKKLITKIATEKNATKLAKLESKPLLKTFWGQKSDMSDGMAGAIVLVFSLITLCICLYMIVKLLKSLLKGRIAVWMYKSVNGDFKDIKLGSTTISMKWLAGYVSMACGFVLTIMVQSSSITTSAMTPLVGLGVINLERIYPLVLGANMGTTVTGILAALASDASKIAITLEVAYAHLLFNISGIFLFYVIWPMRHLPINASRFLGNTTAKYRWFALFYLFIVFMVLPAFAILLSQISFALLIVVFLMGLFTFLFVLAVNYMHRHEDYNKKLPKCLQNDWHCLPVWMRSLEPLDRMLGFCLRKKGQKEDSKEPAVQEVDTREKKSIQLV